jgi:adenylate cyclase
MAAEKKHHRKNRWLVLFLLSASITVILSGIYQMPDEWDSLKLKHILRNMESSSRDFRFVIREFLAMPKNSPGKTVRGPKDGIYNKIVIAAVDDAAMRENGDTYPFDRKYWADFINRINQRPDSEKPKMVFFDIVFADASQKPASDAALIAAFSNYRGGIGEDIMLDALSINASFSTSDPEALKQIQNQLLAKYTLNADSQRAFSIGRFRLLNIRPLDNVFYYPVISSMMPEIANSLDFLGLANIDNDPVDQEKGKKPMFGRSTLHSEQGTNTTFRQVYFPSIVLSMACRLYDIPLSNVEVLGKDLQLKNALFEGKRTNLVIPLESRYRLPINFRSYPASGFIRIVSTREMEKQKFSNDTILFVGMHSEKGAYDIWPTPLGPMFGIEQLAYALGTVMNRDFILRIPDWANIGYVFAFSLLIGAFVMGGLGWTIAAIFFSILLPFSAGTLLFIANIQALTLLPVLGAILTVVTMQLIILLSEQREKQFIKATFSKYVNPALVDILIQNPELMKLGGTNAELTVFFSDIKGFATMAAEKNPAEMVKFLNDFFSRMTGVVMDSNGTIDKYMGDVLMAFWGAPIEDPDNALRACEAAIRMMDVLEKFNRERIVVGEKPVQIDIGMNTGNMIVGNVGSEKIKNYTVMGDGVNLASRLKGLNKFYHTNIVISEFTYAKVKEHVIVRELDLTRVKGKAKPVRIYELLDLKSRS